MSDQTTQSTPRLSGKSKDELAQIAYDAIKGVEFLEMNDGNRMGYHVYLYLNGDLPTVAEAIYEAKARYSISAIELEKLIAQRLSALGVQ